MIGIYKIVCIPTNETYIGSSINIASRKASHLYRLRNNKHHNPILQSKYNKYKEESFEFSIVEICSKENLLEREQFYLDTLSPRLNCNPIAGRPPKILWNSKSRQKMSISKKGKSHKNKRVYSEEGIIKVKENTIKLLKEGKLSGKGEKHPGSFLKEKEVLIIKELIEENILELKQIGLLFNVTYACISDIKYNRSWLHLRPTTKTNGKCKLRSLSYEDRLNISKVYKKLNYE